MVFTYEDGEKVDVEIPRIYYHGYRIISPKGKTIKYKESKNGFISFKINEKGTYTVKYLGTILETIASFIFNLTLCGIAVVLIISDNKKNVKHLHNKNK